MVVFFGISLSLYSEGSTERDNLAWLAWWQKQNQDPSGGNVHHLNAAVTYSAASYVYTTTFYKN